MKKFYFYYICLLVIILLNNLANTKLVETEKLLINNLLNTYDKTIRPSDLVEIKFSLYLNQIITIIEQQQILVINVFLDHEWIDPRLAWDPNEYENISLLRINADSLWTPDTFIGMLFINCYFYSIIQWENYLNKLKNYS